MLTAGIDQWAAWAPGCEDAAAWRRWAAAPGPVGAGAHPEARFLPPLLRRRCTPLTRIMLTAAYACCPEAERAEVRTVFASRHGSINESIGLLESIVRGERISPAKFSHTVHNAQAGLYSIAAGNRRASSSLSAREDTFGCAYLEALTHLAREPDSRVLLVMGDVPLADTFAPLVTEPPASYALALLLAGADAGPRVQFELGTGDPTAAAPAWPDALEFLRWWLGPAPTLTLGTGRLRWTWSRVE